MDTTTKKRKFKRLPIFFNEREYKRDNIEVNWAMVHLNSALAWCGKYVNTSEFDMVRFQVDAMSEFLTHLKEENQNKIQLDVSAHKIADLLEIDMSDFMKDLHQIKKYSKLMQYVVWNNNTKEWENKLPKENYTRFTQDDVENEKYKVINELNDVLDKVRKYNKVYPLNIMQGTSQFVEWDNDNSRFILSQRR